MKQLSYSLSTVNFFLPKPKHLLNVILHVSNCRVINCNILLKKVSFVGPSFFLLSGTLVHSIFISVPQLGFSNLFQ